jgi:hypothetical protein
MRPSQARERGVTGAGHRTERATEATQLVRQSGRETTTHGAVHVSILALCTELQANDVWTSLYLAVAAVRVARAYGERRRSTTVRPVPPTNIDIDVGQQSAVEAPRQSGGLLVDPRRSGTLLEARAAGCGTLGCSAFSRTRAPRATRLLMRSHGTTGVTRDHGRPLAAARAGSTGRRGVRFIVMRPDFGR